MATFYATTTIGCSLGTGYFEIKANSEIEARSIAQKEIGKNWAFIYESLADVIEKYHELDRKCHGVLTPPEPQ